MNKVDFYSFIANFSESIKSNGGRGFLIEFLNANPDAVFSRIRVVSASLNPLTLQYHIIERSSVGPRQNWEISKEEFFVGRVLPPRRGSPLTVQLRFWYHG